MRSSEVLSLTTAALHNSVLGFYLEGHDARSHAARISGVEGLAEKLGSDVTTGITTDDFAQRKQRFGENQFATPPLATYFELFIQTFEATLCFA